MPGLIFRTLNTLKRSKFRSKFKLSQKDQDYIATKGLETIKEHAYQFVNSRVASADPKNDGKQTPMRGHPVFIAQHATATCSNKIFLGLFEFKMCYGLDNFFNHLF